MQLGNIDVSDNDGFGKNSGLNSSSQNSKDNSFKPYTSPSSAVTISDKPDPLEGNASFISA